MTTFKKNLYILSIVQFFAMAGLSSIVPFLPLFIRDLGITDLNATAMWSGWVFSAPFIIAFLITPIWGNLGDKYGRKIMLVRAAFGLAISQLLIGFSQDVYQLFFFRILQGLLSGFFPASIAFIASNAPREKSGYAMGLLQSSNVTGNIVGPLIGGVISDLLGYRNVFLIVGLIVFAASFLILFFVKEEHKPDKSQKNYSLLENWRYLINSRLLRYFTFFVMLSALTVALIRPILVLYIESFHVERGFLPTITGLILSTIGIFSAISAVYLGRTIDKPGSVKKLIIASCISSLMFMAHYFLSDLYSLFFVNVVLGLSYGIINPIIYATISKYTDNIRKGGIMGIASSSQFFGNMVGPILSGYLVGWVGLRFSFIISGLIISLIALFSIKFLRHKKEFSLSDADGL